MRTRYTCIALHEQDLIVKQYLLNVHTLYKHFKENKNYFTVRTPKGESDALRAYYSDSLFPFVAKGLPFGYRLLRPQPVTYTLRVTTNPISVLCCRKAYGNREY